MWTFTFPYEIIGSESREVRKTEEEVSQQLLPATSLPIRKTKKDF
jgi:hypothetical protein